MKKTITSRPKANAVDHVQNQNKQTLRIENNGTPPPDIVLVNTKNGSHQNEFTLKHDQHVQYVCFQYFKLTFRGETPAQVYANTGAQNGNQFTPNEYRNSPELYRLRLQIRKDAPGKKPGGEYPNGLRYCYTIDTADGRSHDPWMDVEC